MTTMTRPNPRQRALRRLRTIGLIAVVAAVALAILGIATRFLGEASLAKKTDIEAVPTVAVIEPEHGTANQELVLPGDIQAFFEAPIFARVAGYLKQWDQDIGAHVKAGQELAEIDTPDLDQQLRQAEADLAAAQANQKLAALTSHRWQALVKTDSVSQQETDEKAGAAEAKQADVAAAQANVNRLQALEAFKRIVAPYDGVVTARETDVGALINVGSGPGPELFRVADVHEMRIYVHVPQAMSGGITVGQEAELHLPQAPDKVFKAKVATTSLAINPTSRTLLVELHADNPDGALQPGTYAEVHFKLPAIPNVLRIPGSALLFRQNGLEVAILGANDKVTLKHVTVGRDLGTEVEIVAGLDAGDRVINNPPDSLAENDTVRTDQPVKAAEADEGRNVGAAQ
jgi:RND family efflux transporter MFP subunit